MEVTRTQYPIGQGCFHAGHVRWNENSRLSDDFRYVYDCGSSDGSAALQDSIVAWRTHASRIDALFVSHLDADHVNGLDRLLGSVTVDTVYIPYLDAAALVVDILEAEVDGAVSASLVEAHLDPQSWFGRRGVARIVRVRVSIGDGGLDTESSPPDVEPDEDLSLGGPLPPKVPFDAKSRADRSQGAGRASLETMDSGEMVVVNPGQPLLWVLVPHVDPAPQIRRSAFYREVRQVLGLAPYQRLRADRLAAAIRDREERRSFAKLLRADHFRRIWKSAQPRFALPVFRSCGNRRARALVALYGNDPLRALAWCGSSIRSHCTTWAKSKPP